MFRTVPLSIIRRFSLYTQQWYMSYRYGDSLLAFIIRIYHEARSPECQIQFFQDVTQSHRVNSSKGNMIFQNTGKHSTNNTASHPGRHASPSKPMQKYCISQESISSEGCTWLTTLPPGCPDRAPLC